MKMIMRICIGDDLNRIADREVKIDLVSFPECASVTYDIAEI